jgi:AcrR family transcriptional regulator
MSEARTYTSPLRRDQAQATRDRILDAVAAELEARGGLDGVSNRLIAERAGVTEITVYRHFPSRDALLAAMWTRLNTERGVRGGFPDRLDEVEDRLTALFTSFDDTPAHITATVTTPQGREMRASQDEARRAAWLSALKADFPDLSDTDRARAAGVLQLMNSAYAWLSLREQWGMDGPEAATAARWAVRALINDLKSRGDAPLDAPPAHREP